MIYNNELEKIDTIEKAYLLGLFYSDGYVCSANNTCAITLHEQDINLLEELVNIFPFFKIVKSHVRAYKMLCISKALKIHLMQNGVLLKKSSLNKENLTIKHLDNKLLSHFIRGFFDGDGSVYSQKLFNIKIEIGATSFNLITEIIKILYDNNITVNLTCSYEGSGLRTMNYYKLFTSSYKISKLFSDYIYKDASIYMKRKFEKLNIIPEYIGVKSRLQCNNCGSFNTFYNGFRGNKTRIKCKDCKKMTSIITAPVSSNINSGEDELLEN